MAPQRKSHSKPPSGRKPKSARRAGPSGGPLRLQRLLASAGYGSRRQCEELIEAGRVEVDGEIVTRLGTTVDPEKAKVRVDGDVLKKRKLLYYAVNKPIGVVTTNRDPQGRPRVVDLVPPDERVFAVGRLDLNSEGLILLTNDGELAQKLSHPKFGVRKVYRVTVAGKVDGETMKRMRQGIYIAEGLVRVEGAKLLKTRSRSTEMEIVLREGKNREIRRILARLGHKVQHLRRIAVGPLRLGDLPSGAYRVVQRNEVEKLWQVTEAEPETAGDGRKRGSKKRGIKKRGAKKFASKTKRPTTQRDTDSSQRGPKRGGRKRAKPEFTPTGSVTSDTTTGAVIGGDPSESSSSAEATPSRGRKSVKPRKGKSAAPRKGKSAAPRKGKSAKRNASSNPRGSKRRGVKPKQSRGKKSGPAKKSAKKSRRKRN